MLSDAGWHFQDLTTYGAYLSQVRSGLTFSSCVYDVRIRFAWMNLSKANVRFCTIPITHENKIMLNWLNTVIG